MSLLAEVTKMNHKKFLKTTKLFSLGAALILQIACGSFETRPDRNSADSNSSPKIIADKFAYPIGKTEIATAGRDKKDEWFNAQDFGENDHLGEDWNKNSGGNTDCGEPVFAAASGRIVFAEYAGTGWGNVVIIEHDLPDGTKVQTLYGHLEKILKTGGDVKMREQLGTVGSADGKYLCHLHFELRAENCPMWNAAGAGYSAERNGWLDPSDFIDKRRN